MRAGIPQVSGGGNVGACQGQTHARHVVVDAFILACRHLIRFVPDADGAVFPNALVKGLPRGKVMRIAGLSVGDQMVKTTPVLREHNSAPVERCVRTQKS